MFASCIQITLVVFPILLQVLCHFIHAFDYYSGEVYFDNFIPFHSAEIGDHHYAHVHSSYDAPYHGVHCTNIVHQQPKKKSKNYWPILDKLEKIKPAPPAPTLGDHRFLIGPEPITNPPFLPDDFEDGYTNTAYEEDYDDKKIYKKKKKVTFDECFSDCPAPREGKAVCGDDGNTYENIHRLNCAVRCGIIVKFKSMGECPFPDSQPDTYSSESDFDSFDDF